MIVSTIAWIAQHFIMQVVVVHIRERCSLVPALGLLSVFSATPVKLDHYLTKINLPAVHKFQVKEGFSMSAMRQKDEMKFPSPPAKKTTPPVFSFEEDELNNKDRNNEEDLLATLSENTSKTTAVVQVSGALDLLVTPLLLESLQR